MLRRSLLAGTALAGLVLLTIAAAPRAGAPTIPGLDAFVAERMQAAKLPGLQAVIVKDGAVVWEGAYGLADLSTQRRVTHDTLFMVASVSKAVTGTALVQLADAGKLDLDQDISTVLPYQVVHPFAPTTPISPRRLLTHTASIEDNWTYMDYHPGDCPVPLAGFCENYFTQGGRYSDVHANWYPVPPGSVHKYSNAGYALVGALVEAASGLDFDDYCQANIFAPLGMNASSYRISKLDQSLVAHPYSWSGGSWVDHGFYGFPDYPDGTLRTSARQLAAFAIAHMDGGGAILSPAAATDMQTVQYPRINKGQGLAFYHSWKKGDPASVMLGHNGGDKGVQADLWMRPWDDRTAVIVLANGDGGHGPQKEIIDKLFEVAAGL